MCVFQAALFPFHIHMYGIALHRLRVLTRHDDYLHTHAAAARKHAVSLIFHPSMLGGGFVLVVFIAPCVFAVAANGIEKWRHIPRLRRERAQHGVFRKM